MPQPRILLKEGRPDLFAELDTEKNIEVGIDADYLTTGSGPVYWFCKYGHKWRNAVYNRNIGANCRICRKVKYGINDLFSQRKDLVSEWDYGKNSDLNIMDYSYGSDKVVWWKCAQCNHSWEKKIMHRSQGSGCPVCKNGSRPSKPALSKRPKPLLDDPILLSEWDYEKNLDLDPKKIPRNSHKYVWWICRFDPRHTWNIQIIARTKGERNCPICSNSKIIAGLNHFPTTHPELLTDWDFEKNTLAPTDYSFGSGSSMWWKCLEGHSWKAPIKSRFIGNGCPVCNGVTSKIQQDFYQELVKSIPDLENDIRLQIRFKSLRTLSVDMISRKNSLVIEYDGVYYHSGERSEKGLDHHLDHDSDKTRALINAGYRVIRIRENELQHLDIKDNKLIQITHKNTDPISLTVEKILDCIQNTKNS